MLHLLADAFLPLAPLVSQLMGGSGKRLGWEEGLKQSVSSPLLWGGIFQQWLHLPCGPSFHQVPSGSDDTTFSCPGSAVACGCHSSLGRFNTRIASLPFHFLWIISHNKFPLFKCLEWQENALYFPDWDWHDTHTYISWLIYHSVLFYKGFSVSFVL